MSMESFFPIIRERRDQPSTVISRLDCVLTESGELRVIEINPVAICLYHLRSLLYLQRELQREGWGSASHHLDQAAVSDLVNAFVSTYRERAAQPTSKPTIGFLMPKRFFRATPLLFRDAFRRHGCEFVVGCTARCRSDVASAAYWWTASRPSLG